MSNIPYFKFLPSEWFSGNIAVAEMGSQGIFISLCALYWQKGGKLKYDSDYLSKFLRVDKQTLSSALADLKHCLSVNEGMLQVKFLDEQLQEFKSKHQKKVESGRKGGNARALNTSSSAQAVLKQPLAIEIRKDKIRKDKENIKELALNDSIESAHSKKSVKSKIVFDWDKECFLNISQDIIEKWEKSFPAVNILLQIKQAEVWQAANPKKRKSDYRRFLTNWLSRHQEKGGDKPSNSNHQQPQNFGLIQVGGDSQ